MALLVVKKGSLVILVFCLPLFGATGLFLTHHYYQENFNSFFYYGANLLGNFYQSYLWAHIQSQI